MYVCMYVCIYVCRPVSANRLGSSTSVLVLKSALSTFQKCLDVLTSILSTKAFVLVLEHFLVMCFLSIFKALSTFFVGFVFIYI